MDGCLRGDGARGFPLRSYPRYGVAWGLRIAGLVLGASWRALAG